MSEEITLSKEVLSEINGKISIPENSDGHMYIYIWSGTESLTPLYRKIKVF